MSFSKGLVSLGFIALAGGGIFVYQNLNNQVKAIQTQSLTLKGFTDEQKKNVEDIIKDFVQKHPEEIIEAVNKAVQNQQVKMRESIEANVLKYKDPLFKGITLGNPKADVHLAVVIDPLCPHCLEFQKILHVLLEKRKDFQIHLTYVGILGPNSEALAKTFLSAAKQSTDKFEKLAFKIASNTSKDTLSRSKLLALATEAGLDTKALEAAEISDEIKKVLENNRKLAEDIKLPGVPFILGFFAKGNDTTIIPPIDLEGFNLVLDRLKLDKATALKEALTKAEQLPTEAASQAPAKPEANASQTPSKAAGPA